MEYNWLPSSLWLLQSPGLAFADAPQKDNVVAGIATQVIQNGSLFRSGRICPKTVFYLYPYTLDPKP